MHSPAPDKRFRLRVSGMTCPSCEHHVERSRPRARTMSRADFRRCEVVLTAPVPSDERGLAQAVEEAGYAAGPCDWYLRPIPMTPLATACRSNANE
jgi:cation transport ATPase